MATPGLISRVLACFVFVVPASSPSGSWSAASLGLGPVCPVVSACYCVSSCLVEQEPRSFLNILFLFLFEITDFCDRVSRYGPGWWWACSSASTSPVLAQLADMCLLDWLSIKAFLTHVVLGLSTLWPTSLFGCFYPHILLLAGYELLKVYQGLPHPASGPGLYVIFSRPFAFSGNCPLCAGGYSGFSLSFFFFFSFLF